MPMYSFRCPACGYESEELVSLQDIDSYRPVCPECNMQMDKLISGTATRSKKSQRALDDVNDRYGNLPTDYMGNDRAKMRAVPGPKTRARWGR